MPNNDKNQYPLKKTDYLGRLIYVDWNGVERSIYKYWGDTNKVKIKYRLFHQDTSFDSYDIDGKNIMSYATGIFEISLPRIWSGRNGELQFRVEKNTIINWVKRNIH